MTFRARVRFRWPPGGSFFQTDGAEHQIPTAEHHEPFVLRSGENAGTLISRSEWLTLSLGGLPTHDAARAAGQRAKDAVLWASTRLRLGVNIGNDRQQGSIARAAKEAHLRVHGKELREDVHGLTVVDESVPTQFASMHFTARVGTAITRFDAAFAHAYEAEARFSERERLAAEIYNSTFAERSFRSRLLGLVIAIETLAEQHLMSPTGQACVDTFLGQVRPTSTTPFRRLMQRIAKSPFATIDDTERSSLIARLNYLKYESIGSSCRRLVHELLPDREYGSRTSKKLFKDAYQVRSELVHGGQSKLPGLELSRLSGDVERMVSDLILSHVSRSCGGAVDDFEEPGPYVDAAQAMLGSAVDDNDDRKA